MNFSISTIPIFEKNFKRLLKKYPSLKKDLGLLIEIISANPTHGTALGKNCFKIRMQISSKSKGKSGGGRIISLVKFQNERVVLLTIFDKSELDTIDDKFLDVLIKMAD